MKISVYSDLHNEFSQFDPPPTDADVVVLAGDIDTKARSVKWANEAFSRPVIYVAGHHEFYGGHIDHTLKKMRDAAAPHVHVLENQAWIWQQTRFLCTTAWTDYSSTGDVVAATRICWDWMNDFRAIHVDTNFRRLRPADLIVRNHIGRSWFSDELSKSFNGKTVVVTHHSPTPHVMGDVASKNRIAREWLREELLARPFEGKTMVVTHHSPTPFVAGDKTDGHLYVVAHWWFEIGALGPFYSVQ